MSTTAITNIVMTNIISLKTHSSHDNEAHNSITNRLKKKNIEKEMTVIILKESMVKHLTADKFPIIYKTNSKFMYITLLVKKEHA